MEKAVFAVLAVVFSLALNVQEVLATHEAMRERYRAFHLDGDWNLNHLDVKSLEAEAINGRTGIRDGPWTVQVSASPLDREARQLAKKLMDKGYDAYVASGDIKGGTWYRVRVGPVVTQDEAKKLQETLKNKEKYAHAFVTVESKPDIEGGPGAGRQKLKAMGGARITHGPGRNTSDFRGEPPASLDGSERASVNGAHSNGKRYQENNSADEQNQPSLLRRVSQQQVAEPEKGSEEPRSITIGPAVPERGGVLLRRGQFEIAPELRYALQSTNRIIISGLAVLPAIVIGTIEAAKVRRNIVESSVSLRYGILDDLQFDVRLPWRYSNDRITTLGGGPSPAREIRVDDFAFGDLEGSLSYQIFKEQGPWPALVAGLGLRTTTGKDPFEVGQHELPSGTGFWGLRGGLNAIKVRDPVVLFARLGYTANFTRTVTLKPPAAAPAGRTRINPGNTIEWGTGFAYALSPEFSLNTQFVHRLTLRSEIEKVQFPVLEKGRVPGTFVNIPEIRFGGVWAYTRDRLVDVSVSVGLSEDAPGVTFQLALPFRFESPQALLRTFW